MIIKKKIFMPSNIDTQPDKYFSFLVYSAGSGWEWRISLMTSIFKHKFSLPFNKINNFFFSLLFMSYKVLIVLTIFIFSPILSYYLSISIFYCHSLNFTLLLLLINCWYLCNKILKNLKSFKNNVLFYPKRYISCLSNIKNIWLSAFNINIGHTTY